MYYIEMTDTYGGEANYCWVNRFLVNSVSERGAIGKVTKKTGYHARKQYEGRYRVPGACITYFIEYLDQSDCERIKSQYSRIEEL